jgi:hypothetical protein
MYRAARPQISAQSRSSSMHRTIILMSCSCKQDAAQCSHAVTHSLQTSIQLSYCSCDITFLLFCFVCFCLSERRVRKFSALVVPRRPPRPVPTLILRRRGAASLWGVPLPKTDPVERCISSHSRNSFFRSMSSPSARHTKRAIISSSSVRMTRTVDIWSPRKSRPHSPRFFPQQHPALPSGLAPAGVHRNFC